MNEIPADFKGALHAAGLVGFFADCTGPHQREYLSWIASAKKAETRSKRIAQATAMLAEKRREEIARTKGKK